MKTIIKPILLLFLALHTTSCVYDDPNIGLENCGHYLEIRPLDGNSSQVNDVAVYIYDANGILIGFEQSNISTPINIGKYTNQGMVKVVAWGNAMLDKNARMLSTPIIGSSISTHSLTPSQNSSTTSQIANNSSDIFYGTIDINLKDSLTKSSTSVSEMGKTTTLYINHALSSYIVTIPKIGQSSNGPNAKYKILVRNPNKGLDFSGKPISGETIYIPDVSYDADKDILKTGVNTTLPTGLGNLIIEIYSNDKLIHTITVDSQGNNISLVANKLHNILINLEREISVVVISDKWGEVVIFEGFN